MQLQQSHRRRPWPHNRFDIYEAVAQQQVQRGAHVVARPLLCPPSLCQDLLVNNAAHVADKLALDMTESDWDRVFSVNLKGAFICSQQAARHMLQQEEGGAIINIGASTGIRGRRNGVNTCASKAGLIMMTQCLALELGQRSESTRSCPDSLSQKRQHIASTSTIRRCGKLAWTPSR